MMRWLGTFAALTLVLAQESVVWAQTAGSEDRAVRFAAVDVVVDAGEEALAAYQIEITADGDAQILSVEGGEHPAFNAPPHYDPAALKGGRIIVAAFSLSDELPSGRTRVAVLHLRESGKVSYRARLLAAARADGRRFTPAVTLIAGGQ